MCKSEQLINQTKTFMDDTQQTIPNLSAMVTQDFTIREWLRYYTNVWNRALVARVCDLQFDLMGNPEEPTEEMVQDARTGQPRPKLVKERLQERKAKVSAALDLLKAFKEIENVLTEGGDSAFVFKYLSEEALKIDESVFAVEEEAGPKAGDACTAGDGKPGTWQDNGNGELVCIPLEDAPAEPAAVDPSPEAAV